jgi:hypothetical protein
MRACSCAEPAMKAQDHGEAVFVGCANSDSWTQGERSLGRFAASHNIPRSVSLDRAPGAAAREDSAKRELI